MDTISPVSDQQKGISKKNRVVKKSSKKMKLRNPRVGSKMKKQKFSRKPKPALYIGHIPHGFYEDEMNGYFSQFGKVHSVTVMRSKKTGRSKGYGFVEFEDEEVAKIASETMNNYLMFSKVLKCKYIPPEEGKRKFSASAICPVLSRVKNRRLDSENKKKAFATLDQESYQKKTHKKINHFKKFLEEKGIDFPFKV